MVLGIISICLSVFCLFYVGHCSIVFHRFNDSIRDWAKSLDDEMMASINLAARKILSDLDQKISESKVNDIKDDNDLNDLNDEKE